MMRMMVEKEKRGHRGLRWIWRFAVAGLLGLMKQVLLWRGASVLEVEAMFWIVCGISVVAVSAAVGGVDEILSGLPLPWLSPVSVRSSEMQRETVSMAIPNVY